MSLIRNTFIKGHIPGFSVVIQASVSFRAEEFPEFYQARLKTAGNKTIRNRFYAIRAIN
jgi:hypothetical protein